MLVRVEARIRGLEEVGVALEEGRRARGGGLSHDASEFGRSGRSEI